MGQRVELHGTFWHFLARFGTMFSRAPGKLVEGNSRKRNTGLRDHRPRTTRPPVLKSRKQPGEVVKASGAHFTGQGKQKWEGPAEGEIGTASFITLLFTSAVRTAPSSFVCTSRREFTGIAATITPLFRPKPLTDGCHCHTLPAAAWRCLALPFFPK